MFVSCAVISSFARSGLKIGHQNWGGNIPTVPAKGINILSANGVSLRQAITRELTVKGRIDKAVWASQGTRKRLYITELTKFSAIFWG